MSCSTLVLGKGFVGRKVAGSLPGCTFSGADIADATALSALFEKLRPDTVINCAGKGGNPNIDWCENHKVATWRSNVEGPDLLARFCDRYDAFLIHISSGCLHEGASPSGAGWTESDKISGASNYYLQSKYAAEQLLSQERTAIIRIRLPIDTAISSRNFLYKVKRFRFISDGVNSVTFLDDLVKVISKVVLERARGIFHCVSPEPITAVEIRRCLAASGLADPEFVKIKTTDLTDLKLVSVPRRDTVLASNRLESLGLSLYSTTKALDTLVSQVQI